MKTGLKHRKKFYFREAITSYTKGLEIQCANPLLNAIILSNRAQVHLLLGNNKNALEDSIEALNLDKSNLKVSCLPVPVYDAIHQHAHHCISFRTGCLQGCKGCLEAEEVQQGH